MKDDRYQIVKNDEIYKLGFIVMCELDGQECGTPGYRSGVSCRKCIVPILAKLEETKCIN